LGSQYEWAHTMKTISQTATGLGFCFLLVTGCASAWATQPYDGLLASTKAARLVMENGPFGQAKCQTCVRCDVKNSADLNPVPAIWRDSEFRCCQYLAATARTPMYAAPWLTVRHGRAGRAGL
jgi:hypothetical protein